MEYIKPWKIAGLTPGNLLSKMRELHKQELIDSLKLIDLDHKIVLCKQIVAAINQYFEVNKEKYMKPKYDMVSFGTVYNLEKRLVHIEFCSLDRQEISELYTIVAPLIKNYDTTTKIVEDDSVCEESEHILPEPLYGFDENGAPINDGYNE